MSFVSTKVCLSREKKTTSFVATKVCLLRQRFAATKLCLSRHFCRVRKFLKAYFCRNKRRVLSRQTPVCCDKQAFVATKKILVAAPANDSAARVLSSVPPQLWPKVWHGHPSPGSMMGTGLILAPHSVVYTDGATYACCFLG